MTSIRRTRTALPVRYLLVSWLFVLSSVAYLDRTNISIAGIQIGHEYRIDNTHLGWVFSAFLIGYAVFQVPAGLLAHRFGSRRLLTFAVVWWGIFTVLTTLVPPTISHAVGILILVRFALGAGEATMYPAASQFVERWFPISERGKANGIIFGGVGVGSGFTPPIVTAIILHFGWRASFWVSAVCGLLAGLIWYLAARDTPEEHLRVSERELALIQAGRGPDRTSAAAKHSVPWRRILSSKEIIALTLSYLAYGYVAWVFFGWFYIYLAQARGLNLKTSAVYSILPFVGMTIGAMGGGIASDWLVQRFSLRVGRCILPFFAMATTSALLVVGSRAEQARTAGIVLALGAGVLYIAQSCFWAITADFAGEYAGLVSGIMNMGAQIGGAVATSLTPFLAARLGWQAAFFTASGLAVIGALAWLLVDPRKSLVSGTTVPKPSLQES
jgi:ACS family glucarate transporter-like MFS transporter